MTFRTTFRDSLSSRQIALIDLQSEKYARRIFAIVSTISIPASASQNHGSHCGPSVRGSRLDADHPENGVPIARRFHNRLIGRSSAGKPNYLILASYPVSNPPRGGATSLRGPRVAELDAGLEH